MTDQSDNRPLSEPLFIAEASQLAATWRKASLATIKKTMHLSDTKAQQVKQLYDTWSREPAKHLPAIDAFRGDIYSGLQVAGWSNGDRKYAHERLVILSGLYGTLRACDGVQPYRLEMGYKLPSGESMYAFWGDKLASIISSETECIINLSAVEYTKALLPHVSQQVITPKFLTISPKTGDPEFVVVHAKIARGAFASWLVRDRIDTTKDMKKFTALGYEYNASLSTVGQPVFVCKTFQGIGLSVRLPKT